MKTPMLRLVTLATFLSISVAALNPAHAQAFMDPPPVYTCACEHLSTQWDGLCEAYVLANEFDVWGQSRIVSWDFSPFGQAIMPFGYNSQSGFGYYNLLVTPGNGGLNVTLSYRPTMGDAKIYFAPVQLPTIMCSIGT